MARNQLVQFIAVFIVSLTVSACDGLRQYSQYEDINAVRADGAFERGWFPDWMPNSAVDIHEFHDLDTNQQAISFRLKPNRVFVWPERCTPSKSPIKPRFKTKLFPNRVYDLPNVQNCRDYYAVQDSDGIVHMWSPF
ncbi:MAG: hypothetical protein P8H62_12685 [Henriciella sp.]|nr:hypothetical protein [Henriciella sp.]